MKLIDKDALVAEIERQRKIYMYDVDSKHSFGRMLECNDLLVFLNTLEVKEVDLEKEIQQQYNVHKNPDNSIVKDCVIMTKDGFEYFAKHFFDLGMQQSKNYNNNEE